MASEIAHIVYGARLLTHLGKNVRDPAYWLGVVFPDIRQIGAVSRHPTHQAGVSLKTLVGNDDFATGVRVHTWIDATRMVFLSNNHIADILAWHPFLPIAFDLLEDEMLYGNFDDWNLIHRLLNKTVPHERELVDDESTIQAWHSLLQDYFAHKPSDNSRSAWLHGLGVSRPSSQEINSLVERLTDSGAAVELLRAFWHELEDLLR